MKKSLIITSLVVATLCGCRTIPTPEKMESTATAIGYTAGLVANNVGIKEESRNVIVNIISLVKDNTPTNNQTFVEAWTPLANEIIKKFVDEGKIDVGEAALISKVFDIVTNGMDYIFDKVYPKAREYENLVTAAIRGFSSGFLETFKPVNRTFNRNIDFNEDAYNYLLKYL